VDSGGKEVRGGEWEKRKGKEDNKCLFWNFRNSWIQQNLEQLSRNRSWKRWILGVHQCIPKNHDLGLDHFFKTNTVIKGWPGTFVQLSLWFCCDV
jgi:hypothetical protein